MVYADIVLRDLLISVIDMLSIAHDKNLDLLVLCVLSVLSLLAWQKAHKTSNKCYYMPIEPLQNFPKIRVRPVAEKLIANTCLSPLGHEPINHTYAYTYNVKNMVLLHFCWCWQYEISKHVRTRVDNGVVVMLVKFLSPISCICVTKISLQCQKHISSFENKVTSPVSWQILHFSQYCKSGEHIIETNS